MSVVTCYSHVIRMKGERSFFLNFFKMCHQQKLNASFVKMYLFHYFSYVSCTCLKWMSWVWFLRFVTIDCRLASRNSTTIWLLYCSYLHRPEWIHSLENFRIKMVKNDRNLVLFKTSSFTKPKSPVFPVSSFHDLSWN